jgi:hypothetical protein
MYAVTDDTVSRADVTTRQDVRIVRLNEDEREIATQFKQGFFTVSTELLRLNWHTASEFKDS